MKSFLQVDPAAAVPIWKQIEEGFRRLLLAEHLPAGAPVPSVRELARELGINPATVAKAYQRLVDDGLLVVQRGEGTFVAESVPAVRLAERGHALRAEALRFAATASDLGASLAEAQAAVAGSWQTLIDSKPGAGQ